MSVVEARQTTGDLNTDTYYCPTAGQLRMETWLNVVHKMKGISWFYHQGVFPPTDHYPFMEQFLRQITELSGVILGPETGRTITDDANTKPRVDTMLREDSNNVWIFAVRVTELDEAGSINVTFNVSGVSAAMVTVYEENRTINGSGGSFTDTFALNDVHIYKIPK